MSDQVALHYTSSTLRERIVEHVFVGEALRALWRRGIVDVEVLRSEFDAHGYDLVMSRGKVTRHIQFKTGTRPKPLRKVIIARAMEAKPSGCVLWISISQDLDLLSFWWFGGEPGDKIPPMSGFANARRIGRQASGNRPERSAQCSIPPSRFRCLTSVDEVLETLYEDTSRTPRHLDALPANVGSLHRPSLLSCHAAAAIQHSLIRNPFHPPATGRRGSAPGD